MVDCLNASQLRVLLHKTFDRVSVGPNGTGFRGIASDNGKDTEASFFVFCSTVDECVITLARNVYDSYEEVPDHLFDPAPA